MSRSRVVISLLLVIGAILLQTTAFAPGRIEPFGVAPALVTLVVIGIAAQIESEYLLLVGFTAGILMDLIGGGTLGLWAMTLTLVAYGASRLKGRFSEGAVYIVAIVFALTISGQLIFVVLSTLFGHGTVGEPRVVANILLPSIWNVFLALPVFWFLSKVYGPQERGWAV